MAEAYKKLAQTLIDSTVEAVYTVPGATQAIIKHMVITNNTGSTVTDIFMYHDGSSDINCLLPGVPLEAGEWCEFEGTITMETGDTLQAKAGTDDVLGLTVHGLEIT